MLLRSANSVHSDDFVFAAAGNHATAVPENGPAETCNQPDPDSTSSPAATGKACSLLTRWQHAIQDSDLPGNAKLVAYNLSMHMDTKGGQARPSIETQARTTKLCEKTVKTQLAFLCKAGYLSRWLLKDERATSNRKAGQNWRRYQYIATFPHDPATPREALNEPSSASPCVTAASPCVTNASLSEPLRGVTITPPYGEGGVTENKKVGYPLPPNLSSNFLKKAELEKKTRARDDAYLADLREKAKTWTPDRQTNDDLLATGIPEEEICGMYMAFKAEIARGAIKPYDLPQAFTKFVRFSQKAARQSNQQAA